MARDNRVRDERSITGFVRLAKDDEGRPYVDVAGSPRTELAPREIERGRSARARAKAEGMRKLRALRPRAVDADGNDWSEAL
jgi:hypothetical protein